MTERFEYTLVWSELDAAKTRREYATSRHFTVYGDALEAHQRSCQGLWVNELMVKPQVTELVAEAGGKRRTIRPGLDLWVDDRPGLSREEFVELRRRLLSSAAGRVAGLGAVA